MAKVIEMTGLRYGRWTVLGPGEPAADGRTTWHCRCDCGVERPVRGEKLHGGSSASCGCANPGNTAHGHGRNGKRTGTYDAWRNMLSRCTNPKRIDYARYGGRGITVCERWISFENFLADVGEKPIGRSLDRVDNSRGYEPGNVQWSTPKGQARNRRSNSILEFQGIRRCIAEWAEQTGIQVATIQYRLRAGWSAERALTVPVRSWLKSE
jgi:hypothetical protein